MPKPFLQDMVKAKRINSVSPKKPPNTQTNILETKKILPYPYQAKNQVPKYRIYLVALGTVLAFLFALSFLFSKAKISIEPRIETIALDGSFSATKGNSTEALNFDLIAISGEEEKIIESGEYKNVSIKASGSVILYNNFSTTKQNLDIDTRLEGSNGKIYKTSKKVTIPGMKGAVPGSIEVPVYASEPGDSYNSKPLDFTIFGFKGTPKYSKFYGRSKGDISGGFVGKQPIVSDLDKVSAINELKELLRVKLSKQVVGQVPSDFILFKDAVYFDLNEKNISFSTTPDERLTLKLKGSVYGFLFNEKKISRKIAEAIVEKYDSSDIYINNIQSLNFSISEKGDLPVSDVKSIKFKISGTPQIVFTIDEIKFKSDLVGKRKKDFDRILSEYPNISSTEIVMRPFWKGSFPKNIEKIETSVNYPKTLTESN